MKKLRLYLHEIFSLRAKDLLVLVAFCLPIIILAISISYDLRQAQAENDQELVDILKASAMSRMFGGLEFILYVMSIGIFGAIRSQIGSGTISLYITRVPRWLHFIGEWLSAIATVTKLFVVGMFAIIGAVLCVDGTITSSTLVASLYCYLRSVSIITFAISAGAVISRRAAYTVFYIGLGGLYISSVFPSVRPYFYIGLALIRDTLFPTFFSGAVMANALTDSWLNLRLFSLLCLESLAYIGAILFLGASLFERLELKSTDQLS